MDVYIFCFKWINAVASDLGICFLIFSCVIMVHIDRLSLLLASIIVEGVGHNIALYRNFTTSSVVNFLLYCVNSVMGITIFNCVDSCLVFCFL